MVTFTCSEISCYHRLSTSYEVAHDYALDADASATCSDNTAVVRPETVHTPLFIRLLSASSWRLAVQYFASRRIAMHELVTRTYKIVGDDGANPVLRSLC